MSAWPRPTLSQEDRWRRYDAVEARLTAAVSERMLDLAEVGTGQRLLDVASGRGEPALRAAARVGPRGQVVATDGSAAMLDFARLRAAADGLANLRFEVAAAETLAGVDGPFDAALCRWGLMYMDDPQAALAAVRQRLRPGAPLVAAVWAEPARVSYWSMPRDLLARHIALLPEPPDAPGTFRFAAPGQLRDALLSAGLEVVHESEMATPVMEAATPDALVDWCLAAGLARALAGQPTPVWQAWADDMHAQGDRYRDTDGMIRLGGVTRIAVARRAG